MDQVPSPDIVVVPGGFGTREVIHDKPIIEWIRKVRHSCSSILIIGITIQQVLCRILLVGHKSDPHEMTDLSSNFPRSIHQSLHVRAYIFNQSLDTQMRGDFVHSSQSTAFPILLPFAKFSKADG